MIIRLFIFSLLFFVSSSFSVQEETIFMANSGSIHFKSDAPLELIEASSDKLKGAIDVLKKTFAFSMEMSSFEGFNSPLQRIHFNENYLESKVFPKATFTGKIIENVDLLEPGEYTLRAKGKLTIHGVTQERIIKSKIKVEGEKLYVQSSFRVLLKEHDIDIPKIVFQKIAEEIQVDIKAEFSKRTAAAKGKKTKAKD